MTELKVRLVKKLEAIEGLTHQPWPDREDGFSTLHLDRKEIGHFHQFNELDLKLGKRLIRQEGLIHNPDSERHPKRAQGSAYIELPFHDDDDVEEIVRLVGLLVADSQ